MNSPNPTPRVLRSPIERQEEIIAERAGEPFLLWRSQDGHQQLLTLNADRSRVTIGRDPGTDVSLDWDREVSRIHAVLERMASGWTLIDDGLSRNGSFVNGARVLGRRRLAEGDRLCVGVTELTYREPAPRGSDSTVTAANAMLSVQVAARQRAVLIALCRPIHEGRSHTPATNLEIAAEVYLAVDAVKSHLRALFKLYDISDLPQNAKRAELASRALDAGHLTPRDF